MLVRYIGRDMVGVIHGKVYEVMGIEKGWYRIMTELDDDYLFPPEAFELIQDKKNVPPHERGGAPKASRSLQEQYST